MRDEDIVAAARTIRVDLELGSVAEPLDELLARADAGERVADDILFLLGTKHVLREEMLRRLPREQDTSRTHHQHAYQALPGHGDPSTEIVYRCSTCEYEYPIFEVGEPVPDSCPRGHGRLDRVR
jgi:hypothetical protein